MTSTTVWIAVAILCVVLQVIQPVAAADHDYCVIGAGPAGLQLGYFLEKNNRDYVIYEKKSTPGSFFEEYPRLRNLISINKRYTGNSDPDFQLRHDWNSLISDDPELRMTKYTEKLYPTADTLVEYFRDFANKTKLNIEYDTSVQLIRREKPKTGDFKMSLKVKRNPIKIEYCKRVIVATGFDTPKVPNVKGKQYIESYRDVPIDPKSFTGQNVIIFGDGNSAFELADMMANEANYVHISQRSPVRLSFFTHYVGDVRAVNSKFLDQYQLKSLDALLEVSTDEIQNIRRTKSGKMYIETERSKQRENHPLRKPYHRIISCIGWNVNKKMFSSIRPIWFNDKYPLLNPDYESENVPDLYFAGALAHGRDYRKSSGGFIHGFRYLVQAMSRVFEEKYHRKEWSHTVLDYTVKAVSDHVLHRMNTVSSAYQMFGVIGDVIVVPNGGDCDEDGQCTEKPKQLKVYHDLPFDRLSRFWAANVGTTEARFLTVSLEYGPDFQGEKVIGRDRSMQDPKYGQLSMFLHPVIREWHADSLNYWPYRAIQNLTAVSEHHIIEDLHTDWSSRPDHIKPLRRYLKRILAGKKGPPLQIMAEEGDEVPYPKSKPELVKLQLDAAKKLVGLSRVMFALNMTKEELATLQIALKLRKAALPPDDPQLAMTHMHVGFVLEDLAQSSKDHKKVDKIIRTIRSAHEIFKKVYGPLHDHSEMARSRIDHLKGLKHYLKTGKVPEEMIKQEQQGPPPGYKPGGGEDDDEDL